MSSARSPKDDPPQSRPATSLSKEEVKQRAQETIERARETIARTHHVAARTRQLVKQAEEIAQHRQARREYEAERAERLPLFPPPPASPTPVPPPLPHPGVHMVLLEDDPADVFLFREALKELPIPCQLSVLTHAREIDAFVTQAESVAAPPPQLLLLDYFMHGTEAAETIARLRSLPGYDQMPVILFSTLPEMEGQRLSTTLDATAFVQKPSGLEAYIAAVAAIIYRGGCQQPAESATARE